MPTTIRPHTHGNVFLRFCIVYCSQGNREQPAHYLKQYKNAGKRFRVYGAFNLCVPLKNDIATQLCSLNNRSWITKQLDS